MHRLCVGMVRLVKSYCVLEDIGLKSKDITKGILKVILR